MAKYFLFRITENIEQVSKAQTVTFPYLAGDSLLAQDGDQFVLYASGTLALIGVFSLNKSAQEFILHKRLKGTLKQLYSEFSFITEVNETTSRMLKKKSREISQQDFEKLSALF